jgi:hypothetical protein
MPSIMKKQFDKTNFNYWQSAAYLRSYFHLLFPPGQECRHYQALCRKRKEICNLIGAAPKRERPREVTHQGEEAMTAALPGLNSE